MNLRPATRIESDADKAGNVQEKFAATDRKITYENKGNASGEQLSYAIFYSPCCTKPSVALFPFVARCISSPKLYNYEHHEATSDYLGSMRMC